MWHRRGEEEEEEGSRTGTTRPVVGPAAGLLTGHWLPWEREPPQQMDGASSQQGSSPHATVRYHGSGSGDGNPRVPV